MALQTWQFVLGQLLCMNSSAACHVENLLFGITVCPRRDCQIPLRFFSSADESPHHGICCWAISFWVIVASCCWLHHRALCSAAPPCIGSQLGGRYQLVVIMVDEYRICKVVNL